MPRANRALLIFILLLTAAEHAAFAERVRHVIDGDTIVLESNQRVRLIGIDAPEVSNAKYNHAGEFYGNEARSYLRQRIEGKDVRLESGDESFDKYGRRLAYIYLGDDFINREMVEKGYAEVMRKFPNRYKDEFLRDEEEARAGRIGMWSGRAAETHDSSPVPWWVWIAAAVIFGRRFLRLLRRSGF